MPNVCTDPQFLEIMVVFKQIINIIKVAAPIVLIVIMMIDVVKAVSASDYDKISASTKQIPKRLLASSMIFLIPTILEFTLNILDENFDFASCITNAEYENISILYVDRADTFVTEAENTLKESDLIQARSAVALLSDETLRNTYSERLDVISEIIKNRKKDFYDKNAEINASYSPKYQNSSGNIPENKNFPYYAQCDGNSKWRYVDLGNNVTYNTCECGCGYVSLSMIIAGLNRNASLTPDVIIPYVKTFSSPSCPISDAALQNENLKLKYGVKPEVLFGRNSNLSQEKTEKEKRQIVEALRKNKPVELLIPGHYIALVSISGNDIVVLDPGNKSNNGVYTIDAVYNKFWDYANRCTQPEKPGEEQCGFIYAVSYSK